MLGIVLMMGKTRNLPLKELKVQQVRQMKTQTMIIKCDKDCKEGRALESKGADSSVKDELEAELEFISSCLEWVGVKEGKAFMW